MENASKASPRFPKDLLEWAGHHSGGVKRLFDPGSGRPGKELLRTRLISRLEAWAQEAASGAPGTPRILLLVGGPGNGKTEAIEHTINCLDEGLAAKGKLIESLSEAFHPPAGKAVARVVDVDAGNLAAAPRQMQLSIVQDASATAGHEGRPAPELLVEELLGLLDSSTSGRYYLCCVNRGVLDDALIHALDHGLGQARDLLEAVTRSVSLSSTAPSCWPLGDFPEVAVWPMDVESLLVSPGDGLPSPASTLLAYATSPTHWPGAGECPAGDDCPFCHSQRLLAREEPRIALRQILRWYELASGKRWSFRDLFSLVSYLLAGSRPAGQEQQGAPCQWAAYLMEQDRTGEQASNPRRQQLTAAFHLATSSYQHALFHRWDPEAASALRHGIRDLALDKESPGARVLLGLQHFLQERKDSYLPAAIGSLLENLVDLLDPAMASPDVEVAVSGRSKVLLGELDTRFSRSIVGGIDFLRKYQVLAKNELELLRKLAKADDLLSSSSTRRRNPAAASRLQRIVRDFACRLVRRSVCTRSAIVADVNILEAFRQVVEDDDRGQRLFDVAKQVKNLLNNGQDFEVSLTTTFGQPLPPQQRQAILVVPVRQVRMLRLSTAGRPRSPLCFLEVGSGQSLQSIALTYELFKAVKELERGLSPASLPRTVVALLDTTKARLSGPIVRDPGILGDARIRIGADGTEVSPSWDDRFVSVSKEKQA
ncbi:hypothetical protein JH274_09620 [Xanthomonas campestris pv. incanae]|uniref:hypothetical protein n=1 Tax=Xanthomonas campestris TaxID=339 RepID=UPI002368B896|nr:hypothetical protein [Xanthomonas campestris]WDJ83438.1 hypothetical protein JH279_11970 [Xanthomonas campestris pv. incanae]WDK27472.1 hypothetical protein JH274_09620 [Xanthomonas campestris pv. incanae]